MDFIHISEKLHLNKCKDIIYYKVDIDRFLLELGGLKRSCIKDQLRALAQVIEQDKSQYILLDEAEYNAVAVLRNGTSEVYRLNDSFYTLLDAIVDTMRAKVRFDKSGWEVKCRELTSMKINDKHKKISQILLDENLDNDSKYILNYISSDQLLQIIGRLSGVTGTIIKLYAQQIKRVIFWRNDNTLGIQLHNGEYICFDCNPEYYIGLEKIMYTGG